jgi:hypothetical protein
VKTWLIEYKATVSFTHAVRAPTEEEAYATADSKDFGFLQKITEELNKESYEVEVESVDLIHVDIDDINDAARDDRKIHKDG